MLIPSILFLAVFCWGEISTADESLKITAVQFDGGAGKADEDFVEIENRTGEAINLGDYRLVKIAYSNIHPEGNRSNIKVWADDNVLQPGEKCVWACSKDGFAESIGANFSTAYTISKSNTIVIIKGSLNDGDIIDSFSYADSGGDENMNNNNPNSNDSGSDYSGQIIINELYPAPPSKKAADAAGLTDECLRNEFVELKNTSDKDIDFSNWTIRDEKNNKGKIVTDFDDKDFHVFCGSFSLNNSLGGDTIVIYDEDGNIVISQKYQNTKSQYAYAFDGSAWRWTSQPTPGKENIFDKKLSGEISKDKTVYKNIYADFAVKTDRDAEKFTWDFGDGHRSYLKETRHKYEKTGTYHASLKIRGNGEEAFYEFDVKVEKYSAPKIRIVKIDPNPKGSDTDNEWLEVENKSKHNENLKGWSIATGWDNLYNHPIRNDFKIKKGKTKKLTREDCAFTLANSKTKIELRDPSGKVVQKIKYDNGKKSIQEEALYAKEDGQKWQWIVPDVPDVPVDIASTKNTTDVRSVGTGRAGSSVWTGRDLSLLGGSELIGKYTSNPAWKNKIDRQKNILNYGLSISMRTDLKSTPIVLGARTVRENNEYYSFTENVPYEHWLMYLWQKINLRLNLFLNGL